MPNNTIIEVVLKYVTDKSSAANIEKELEAAGIKFNAKLNRYQGAGGKIIAKDQVNTIVQAAKALDQVSARIDKLAQKQGMLSKDKQGVFSQNIAGMRANAKEVFGSLKSVEEVTLASQDYNNILDEVEQGIMGVGQQAGRTTKQVSALGLAMTGFGLQMAGMQLKALGQPIFSSISGFTDFAGQTDPASARWLAAMDRIEQSGLRIGRVFTGELAPALEQIADLAERAAKYIEQHPELAKGAAALAGGAFALGTVAQIAGGALTVSAAALQVAQAVGVGGAAGSAAAGAAGGAAAAALTLPAAAGTVALGGSLAAGYGAAELLDRMPPAISAVGKAVLFALGPLSGLASIGADLHRDIPLAVQFLERLGINIGDLGSKAQSATAPVENLLSQQAVAAFVSFRQQERQAEEEFNRQRADIVDEYGKRRTQLEETYEKRRTEIVQDFAEQQAQALEDFQRQQNRSLRDFNQSEQRSEEDYYANRSEKIKSFGEEAQEAEEAHQKRIKEIRERSQEAIDDALASRNALALVRALRDQEKARSDEEERYQEERQKKSEQLAATLADMEADFKKQRERRLADFEQRTKDAEEDFARTRERERQQQEERLKELDTAHQAEMEQLKVEERDRLQELSDQYTREQNKRKESFAQQLADLDAFHGTLQAKWAAYYQQAADQLQSFIDNNNLSPSGTPTNATGRATGGYAGYGTYQLGERGTEFVMNANTTADAERIMGGALTQGGLLSGLSQSQTINLSLGLPGGSIDRRMVRNIVEMSKAAALAEVGAAIDELGAML